VFSHSINEDSDVSPVFAKSKLIFFKCIISVPVLHLVNAHGNLATVHFKSFLSRIFFLPTFVVSLQQLLVLSKAADQFLTCYKVATDSESLEIAL